MKIPEQFRQSLLQNTITQAMLSACVNSCSQRANQYKEKAAEYGSIANWYGRYNGIDPQKAANKEKYKFYSKKKRLLSILEPAEIQYRSWKGQEQYYLTYYLDNQPSHVYIKQEELTKYPDMSIVPYQPRPYQKYDLDSLVSVQFVDKVLALIDNGDYTYTAD